jgi:CrcB protein
MLDALPPWLIVAIGGGVGAATRYGAVEIGTTLWKLPGWACIFGINVIGSLIAGIVLGLGGGDTVVGWIVVTGFLGGLTTFSTWAVDTVLLAQSHRRGQATFNALGTLATTIIGAWVGFLLVGGDVASLLATAGSGGSS